MEHTINATLANPVMEVKPTETIHLVSNRRYPIDDEYQQVGLDAFHNWVQKQTAYQLDIETNVVDNLTHRELYVIQFGDMKGEEQWVIDYASLPDEAKNYFKRVLSDRSTQKVIHNAMFEYTVIKWCMGIDIDNLWDTYLSLKVMTNGKRVPDKFYSLGGALKELFGIYMSKEMQTTFTGEMMTTDQIVYAAKDVRYMHLIKERIESLPEYPELEHVITLENKAVRAFGDTMAYGFEFSTDEWEENIKWLQPQIEESKKKIYEVMRSEFLSECIHLGFIQGEDEVTINWNSGAQKKAFLSRLYPSLQKFTKPALKSFELELPDGNIIEHLLSKDYEKANELAVKDHLELLKELDFIKMEGDILFNMNSSKQKLQLFQLIKPDLQSTGADAVKYIKHPLIDAYRTYVSKEKLLTSYGRKFYDGIGTDGRIRAGRLDQIKETGRISMSSPAIMTVPADEGDESKGYLGNRYRRPFKSAPGSKLCASDYASQELAIIAYLANETVWLDAIKNGHDLHSVCAALVFKEKWVAAGGHPQGHEKPEKFEAKQMRTFTKTINFGLAYGGGAKMLSGRLDISMNEAKQLIIDYFEAFPKLKAYFDDNARLGVQNGYIETAYPFKRRRYFGEWKQETMDRFTESSIERQSKNTPIQGTGADGTKCAMVYIKNYIEQNNLQDKVKIVMMLHDAIVTECKDEFIPEWKEIKPQLMREGHNTNIPGYLIDADIQITDHWTK